jgi:Inovirus Coat protein B
MKSKLSQLASLAARQRAALGATLLAVGTAAYAEPPAAVVTDLTAMKADGVSMATLVLLAIIGIAAVLFLKRAIR